MSAPSSRRAFYWPAALVLAVMLIGNVAIALVAPREDRVELLAGFNLLCGVALAFMRALVGIAPAAVALLAFSVASSGCGGAIGAQARAITVATVGLEGVHRVALQAAENEIAACVDPSCPAAVEARWQPASDAYTAALGTLRAWLEALEVARIAGDGGDVAMALITAAARYVRDGGALLELVERLSGTDLPDLPALVLGAGAGGEP